VRNTLSFRITSKVAQTGSSSIIAERITIWMRLQSDCDTFWFLIFYSTPASHEPRNYLSQDPLRCVEEALLLSQLARHTYHTLPKYILPYLVLTRCVKGLSEPQSSRRNVTRSTSCALNQSKRVDYWSHLNCRGTTCMGALQACFSTSVWTKRLPLVYISYQCLYLVLRYLILRPFR
jgi:hypothetical protein